VSRPARFTTTAQIEIREAAAWIRKDNRRAAAAFREAVQGVARLIGEHPLVGHVRPELTPAPYRFSVVRGFPYLVVYDPTPARPVIVRVVHGARDLPEVLRDLS
jgi:toxin ParE1/3/4